MEESFELGLELEEPVNAGGESDIWYAQRGDHGGVG